jgi:hypothetical protein
MGKFKTFRKKKIGHVSRPKQGTLYKEVTKSTNHIGEHWLSCKY